MAANLLKMESFVKEEMVTLYLLLGSINFKIGSNKVKNADHLGMIAGRGVDLNRNWGVDWGKKEKVFIHALYHEIIMISLELNTVMLILFFKDVFHSLFHRFAKEMEWFYQSTLVHKMLL